MWMTGLGLVWMTGLGLVWIGRPGAGAQRME